MLIAVYGSLKKGQYNHAGLGDDAKFMGRTSVRAVMYWNGSYPKLFKTAQGNRSEDHLFNANLERTHEVEVYDINKERFARILNMEHGAGYVSEEFDTPWGVSTIFWMPHSHFYDNDDWIAEYPPKKK